MTVDIKRMLFVTDLSNGSNEVFQYAVNLTSALNASIIMLYVMDTVPMAVGVTPDGVLIHELLAGFLQKGMKPSAHGRITAGAQK